MRSPYETHRTTEAVYAYLVAYCRVHYLPPNLREIAAGAGLKSISNVAHHLAILVRQGRAVRVGVGLSRAVVPAEILALVVNERSAA